MMRSWLQKNKQVTNAEKGDAKRRFQIKSRFIISAFMLFFLTALPVTFAYGGWFGSNRPELFIQETIDVAEGSTISIPILFDERSQYRISLNFESKVDFHSEEGKKIDWGGSIDFQLSIENESKVFYQMTLNERLDHTLGYGLGRVKVPDEVPRNEKVVLKIVFNQVDSEFGTIYKSANIVVEKLPYIIFTI